MVANGLRLVARGLCAAGRGAALLADWTDSVSPVVSEWAACALACALVAWDVATEEAPIVAGAALAACRNAWAFRREVLAWT